MYVCQLSAVDSALGHRHELGHGGVTAMHKGCVNEMTMIWPSTQACRLAWTGSADRYGACAFYKASLQATHMPPAFLLLIYPHALTRLAPALCQTQRVRGAAVPAPSKACASTLPALSCPRHRTLAANRTGMGRRVQAWSGVVKGKLWAGIVRHVRIRRHGQAWAAARLGIAKRGISFQTLLWMTQVPCL